MATPTQKPAKSKVKVKDLKPKKGPKGGAIDSYIYTKGQGKD
jgi:hypothetical protein